MSESVAIELLLVRVEASLVRTERLQRGLIDASRGMGDAITTQHHGLVQNSALFKESVESTNVHFREIKLELIRLGGNVSDLAANMAEFLRHGRSAAANDKIDQTGKTRVGARPDLVELSKRTVEDGDLLPPLPPEPTELPPPPAPRGDKTEKLDLEFDKPQTTGDKILALFTVPAISKEPFKIRKRFVLGLLFRFVLPFLLGGGTFYTHEWSVHHAERVGDAALPHRK